MFDDVHRDTRKLLRWDSVAEYSTTNIVTGRRVSEVLMRFGAHCVDATACVGGLTRVLAETFETVTAIELDDQRFEKLVNNMNVLQCTNVRCIHGDCVTLCPDTDVIILDPPWGGRGYKRREHVELIMNGQTIDIICDALASRAKFIALKVPVNFNESSFRPTKCFIHQKLFFDKMNILILKTCFRVTCETDSDSN
jgi:predicted RNA methylase